MVKSEFRASVLDYFLHNIFITILSVLTLGLLTPWLLASNYRWEAENTYINGKQLYFDGKGSQLIGKWIVWLLLTIITCGLYRFIVSLRLKQWVISHTYFKDEYYKLNK
ncbi:DUF898 family protein [Streptobacillus felis]|uniref:DUF898 family protein n=1 Tax=Streptobacillus felis TaxID=1384509 RepID=A0A7Z0PFJ8_9FUSO|nr:DUF898 family protein [Streptobacillus felis]